MNTIPKSSHDQDPHTPSISKEKRKALGAGCVRDTSSPLQNGSVRVFDLQATYPCQAGELQLAHVIQQLAFSLPTLAIFVMEL